MSLFYNEQNDEPKVANITIACIVLTLILITGSCAILPRYRIYSQDLRGQANLRQQEWEKKITIEEARALKESAALKAQAEVERAKGIAEANKIVADSLKGNEAYLRYLWIDKLADNPNVIYVPTEAGLPLLEANRLTLKPDSSNE